jgi:hypothetical protein
MPTAKNNACNIWNILSFVSINASAPYSSLNFYFFTNKSISSTELFIRTAIRWLISVSNHQKSCKNVVLIKINALIDSV